MGHFDFCATFFAMYPVCNYWGDLTGSLGPTHQPLGSRPLKAARPRRLHYARPFPFFLSSHLHFVQPLHSQRRRSAAMGKEKTAALERAKKATGAAKNKKMNRGSSSCSGLPLGWIQGDWIRSSLWQEDLDDMAEL